MVTLETQPLGRSKSALLIVLLLSSFSSVAIGKSILTPSGDARSDSADVSNDRVHSASNSHRKLGWWYNFWIKYSSPKTSSPTKSPTPSPTQPPTEIPTTAPTAAPSQTPTTTNRPTSCENGPEEIFTVNFELALKSTGSGSNITNVTPQEEAEIKNTTLKFLQDNIGGECTFSVLSLVIVGKESATKDGFKDTPEAATIVFSMNATVSMKTSFIASLDEGLSDAESNGSRRLDDVCTEKEKAKCCINGSINKEKSKKCKQKGCTDEDCERKDPDKDTASLFETSESSYYGKDFTDAMNEIDKVQVDSAKSALDVTASVLATCSTAHETIVILRDFGDFISRVYPSFYTGIQHILNYIVVENCRTYTSLECQEIDYIFCDDSNSESSYCEFPCDGVILPLTSTPTPKPTPKPTTFSTSKPTIPQDPYKSATYDDSFNAPRCFTVARGCDSGVSLLNSRGNMSPAEPHASNTIDSCNDGNAGTYHSDESIDRVTVTSVNGGLLTEATEALIEASVWVYSKETDFADFFFAADAASPDWQFIKTVKPTITESLETLNANYTLPAGRNQAVRVVFRFGGLDEKPCPEGPYDDVDDLVFAVVTGSPTVSPFPTLSPTITISPTTEIPLPTVSPTLSPTITISPTTEIPPPTFSPTLLPTLTNPPTTSAHPTPLTFSPTSSPTSFPTTYEPTAVTNHPTLSFSPSVSPTTEQPSSSSSPSAAPTLSLFPTVSSRAPVITATYDTTLKAPKCSMIGGGCATALLLKSRGYLDPAEPNASNTIDNCEDGNDGEYLDDESVESISVTSINGGPLVVGTEVQIDAVVWAWEKESDTVDFWHVPLVSPTNTNWALIRSVKPTKSLSLNTVSTRFVLEDEGDNAVRVVMRYSGFPLACPGGSYDDVDDLVFVVGSGSGNNILIASYDDTFKAPKCSSVAYACYAGPSLLRSRGAVSPGEPNAPNTIDQCEDGNEGEYLSDESIESIKVTALNGDQLVEGAVVRIEAKVWVFSSGDYADFWYAADATLADWEWIDTVNMMVSYQFHTVSTDYTLGPGNLQAVRVVFRFGGNATDCPGGPYDDVDDLVFVVGGG